MKTKMLFGLLMVLTTCLAYAKPVDMHKRARELTKLKWGMFICWSFSTFSGNEWTPGIKDVSFFRATGCDTDQWARTAKEAGMGYILFLTKHHDGFCLWDTVTTERKVTRSPLGYDVLARLRKSCDKYGIKLALYFSEGEFDDNKNYHPGGYTPEMKKAQLKELLTRYGPIEYIWFDHAQTDGGLSHMKTVEWCHLWQPRTLIGFNHGEAAGEVSLREVGRPGPLGNLASASYNSDNEAKFKGYLMAEFTYPIQPAHEGGAMWFYSLPRHDSLCLPADKLYRDYLGAVKYGNIFSIDVGPNYEGKLRDVDVKTLLKVGRMIKSKALLPPLFKALSEGKPARASSIWNANYDASRAFDNDESTRWGASPDSRTGWLEVDLGSVQNIGRAIIIETFHRTQDFAIEYKLGDNWKILYHGGTIESGKPVEFTPTITRYVRLNILKASEVPTIEEFQILKPR